MHLSHLLTATLVGVAIASPVAQRQTQKLRISKPHSCPLVKLTLTNTNSVPLGDSITEITCWRALVWDQISDAKYADKVQYVGSQNSNPQNCKPKTSNWDQHHEGHSGWLAIDIANTYITGWMQKTPADIVMFMLGTNDVFRGRSTNDIIAAYTKIVTVVRAANPRAKFIVRSTCGWMHSENTRTNRRCIGRPGYSAQRW